MLELAQISKRYICFTDGKALLVVDINVFDNKHKYVNEATIKVVLCMKCL